MQASALRPSAIDTAIRDLSGIFNLMISGIGYSAKKISRNAEYAEVKYPRSARTLTGAQVPSIALFQPYSTGLHCTNHQMDVARIQACDEIARPQKTYAVLRP